MALDDAVAVVTAPDGHVQPLGEFLRARKEACGLPVTRIVKAAGISRANFYLLEKGGQRPSLATLVALFGAMGLDTRIPVAEDPRDAVDLVVQVSGDAYMVDLRWTDEERLRSRERYVSAANSGLGAALGGLAGVGVAGLAVGGTPLVVPAAFGGAMVLAARWLRERRAADQAEADAAPAQEAVLADLKDAAASMTTEELEALLAAMKAMREAREGEAGA